MARSSRVPDLVGTSEAADVLQCEKPRIGRYIRTGLMPAPVAKLQATPVWLRSDVLALKEALDARESEHTRPKFRVAPSRPLDLVGTREAAELLGVERTRIGRWLKTGLMPEPLVKLRATPVWFRRDVEALAEERAAQQREREEAKEQAAA